MTQDKTPKPSAGTHDETRGETHNETKGDTKKALTPAAQRALAEAEARRKQRDAANGPKEVGGPKGPEPTRYGDWEKGGVAHDF